jgi:hypothetical protein
MSLETKGNPLLKVISPKNQQTEFETEQNLESLGHDEFIELLTKSPMIDEDNSGFM